jgi:hypothetical protein
MKIRREALVKTWLLVFKAGIGLDHNDGVIPRSVWLEVRVQEKPIIATTSTATTSPPKALLKWPKT